MKVDVFNIISFFLKLLKKLRQKIGNNINVTTYKINH